MNKNVALKITKDKHSSLFRPFVSCKENEVFLMQNLNKFLKKKISSNFIWIWYLRNILKKNYLEYFLRNSEKKISNKNCF